MGNTYFILNYRAWNTLSLSVTLPYRQICPVQLNNTLWSAVQGSMQTLNYKKPLLASQSPKELCRLHRQKKAGNLSVLYEYSADTALTSGDHGSPCQSMCLPQGTGEGLSIDGHIHDGDRRLVFPLFALISG